MPHVEAVVEALWCSVPSAMTQDVVENPVVCWCVPPGGRQTAVVLDPDRKLTIKSWLSAWSAQCSLPLHQLPSSDRGQQSATHLEAILLAIVLITYRFFPEWSGSHVRRPCFSPGSRLEPIDARSSPACAGPPPGPSPPRSRTETSKRIEVVRSGMCRLARSRKNNLTPRK